jgi:hypothetical protein
LLCHHCRRRIAKTLKVIKMKLGKLVYLDKVQLLDKGHVSLSYILSNASFPLVKTGYFKR